MNLTWQFLYKCICNRVKSKGSFQNILTIHKLQTLRQRYSPFCFLQLYCPPLVFLFSMVGCCHHKGGVVSTAQEHRDVRSLLLSYKSFLLTAAALTRSMDRYARMMMLMYVSLCIKRVVGWHKNSKRKIPIKSQKKVFIRHDRLRHRPSIGISI